MQVDLSFVSSPEPETPVSFSDFHCCRSWCLWRIFFFFFFCKMKYFSETPEASLTKRRTKQHWIFKIIQMKDYTPLHDLKKNRKEGF